MIATEMTSKPTPMIMPQTKGLGAFGDDDVAVLFDGEVLSPTRFIITFGDGVLFDVACGGATLVLFPWPTTIRTTIINFMLIILQKLMRMMIHFISFFS